MRDVYREVLFIDEGHVWKSTVQNLNIRACVRDGQTNKQTHSHTDSMIMIERLHGLPPYGVCVRYL